jgi:predicted membrane-bound spermidine synthase
MLLQEPAKRALVVGGGDGGVLRELARHTSLEVRRRQQQQQWWQQQQQQQQQ